MTKRFLLPLLPTDPAQPAERASSSGNSNLIYPKSLTAVEQKAILGMLLVSEFVLDLQQQLLDELAGAIQTKAIRRGVVPYTHGLISSVKSNKFNPSLGVAVLAARVCELEHKERNEESLAKAGINIDRESVSYKNAETIYMKSLMASVVAGKTSTPPRNG